MLTSKPCLEALEDRLVPGGGGGTESITLQVTYQPNKVATFDGYLTANGSPVSGHTVALTGPVFASPSTDSAGHYSYTGTVANLGWENAQDSNGLSNTALFQLVGGSPVISNFTCVAEGSGLWLFSGDVSGAPYQGEVVNFGGITPLMGQSTQVKADGTFSYYAIVPTGQGGWASAQAVDWWGDTSQIATDFCGA